MRQFMLIIEKDGPCVYINGKNRKFTKEEVIHYLRYTTRELETAVNDFEHFKATAVNDFEHFKAILNEDNYSKTLSEQCKVHDKNYDKSLLEKTRTTY